MGPVLFSLYLLPLRKVFDKHGINYHLYADDSQIYFPIKYGEQSSLESLYNCLADVKCWLANNFLQLNEDKSEFIVLGQKGCGMDSNELLLPGKKKNPL